MCSPSYARAISKIWEEYPPTAISHSFDPSIITTSDLFHRQLRYFARKKELSDDIEEAGEAYQKTVSDSKTS